MLRNRRGSGTYLSFHHGSMLNAEQTFPSAFLSIPINRIGEEKGIRNLTVEDVMQIVKLNADQRSYSQVQSQYRTSVLSPCMVQRPPTPALQPCLLRNNHTKLQSYSLHERYYGARTVSKNSLACFRPFSSSPE